MWRVTWGEEDHREEKELVMGRGLSKMEGMVLARDREDWYIDHIEYMEGMSLLASTSVREIDVPLSDIGKSVYIYIYFFFV